MVGLLGNALAGILKPVTAIIDKAVVDKDKAAEIKADLAKLELDSETQIALKQIALNMVESAQGLFKGGWRPAIGWTCALSIFWHFFLQPFVVFGFVMAGFGDEVKLLPKLDIFQILTLTGGMLGIAKLRSTDKEKGVHVT